MTGKIYYLICPITKNPIYVGKTIELVEERLRKHISKTKTKIKYNRKLSKNEYWIKKLINLSIENEIQIGIIEECKEENLNDREIYWISEYRKKFKLNNLSDGGDGGRFFPTEETKKKISLGRKGKCVGKDHFLFGKKRSKETRYKISEAIKGKNHPNFGKPRTEETKRKIGLANKGDKNGMYGVTFSMCKEHKESISNSLKNSKKLKESRNSKEYKEKLSDIFSIPLLLLDEDFNIINEFKNCRECAEYFGYTVGNVKNAVRDFRKLGRKYWIIRKENYKKH